MTRFDLFVVGNNSFVPIETDDNNIQSLSDTMIRERALVGRFSAEAGERAFKRFSIPLFRISMVCEAAE